MWIDDKNKIQVNFSDEQETEVTTALKEHKTLIMEVRGLGEFNPNGKVKNIQKVESIKILPKDGEKFDETIEKIGEIFDRLASKIPPEKWDNLPKDLNENLDHYIYGIPKH